MASGNIGAPKSVSWCLDTSLTPFLTRLKEAMAFLQSSDLGLIRKSSHFVAFKSSPCDSAAFMISVKSNGFSEFIQVYDTDLFET